MYNYDPNIVANKVLLGIGRYEYDRLRDDLNYTRNKNLFLKYLRRNEYCHRRYYGCYDDCDNYNYFDDYFDRHRRHKRHRKHKHH